MITDEESRKYSLEIMALSVQVAKGVITKEQCEEILAKRIPAQFAVNLAHDLGLISDEDYLLFQKQLL